MDSIKAKIEKIKFIITLVVIALTTGCASYDWEKPITAEYDLTKDSEKKVLTYVDQPTWLMAKDNLQYSITRAFSSQLITNVKFDKKSMIPYAELADFRNKTDNISLMSPLQIAKKMDADLVFFVNVTGYYLSEMDQTGFYKGFLAADVSLVDIAKEERLWPVREKSRQFKVAIDMENRGREAAVKRLSGALAHCAVRYLYGCLKKNFKIPEDRTTLGWKEYEIIEQ